MIPFTPTLAEHIYSQYIEASTEAANAQGRIAVFEEREEEVLQVLARLVGVEPAEYSKFDPIIFDLITRFDPDHSCLSMEKALTEVLGYLDGPTPLHLLVDGAIARIEQQQERIDFLEQQLHLSRGDH